MDIDNKGGVQKYAKQIGPPTANQVHVTRPHTPIREATRIHEARLNGVKQTKQLNSIMTSTDQTYRLA